MALPLLDCAEPREMDSGENGDFCFDCHGSAENEDPAPPPAIFGEELGDSHRAHLDDADWHNDVLCSNCHVVPETALSEGHIDSDLPAEVTFFDVDFEGGSAAYDPESRSCTGVYCHRGPDAEGTLVWGGDAMDTDDCNDCHGAPPASPHPQKDVCGNCHSEIIDADRVFLAPERHIDGIVDVDELECNACHGGNANGAPPVDMRGNTDTSARGVGAHQAHLVGSGPEWHAAIACTDCHLVPEEIDAEGHRDESLHAEIVFSGMAITGEADPQLDTDSLICSGVYCHGATLDAGGSNTAPVWNEVGTGQADCGTCHGMPPDGGHPDRDDCATCHADTIGQDYTIIAPEVHINGVVDLGDLDCNSCHGDREADREDQAGWAPPTDLDGEDETERPSVGAHQAHVQPSDWHAEIGCAECHVVPEEVVDAGHFDTDLPAEVVWEEDAIALTFGGTPNYDYETNRCSEVYCHQVTLEPEDESDEPLWTQVDGTQTECGVSCHRLPPRVDHSPIIESADCSRCHWAVVDEELNFICPELHIDGETNVGGSCP